MKFLKELIATTALATAATTAFAGGSVLADQPSGSGQGLSAEQSERVQQSARDYLSKQGLKVSTTMDGTSRFLDQCQVGHDSIVLFRAEKKIGGVLTGGAERNIEVGGFVCQDSTGKTPTHSVASTEYVKPPKVKGP